MTVLRNSFNGGTNTTVITEANSGGASGDALQYVSGSPVFSNTQARSGTLSCRFPASSFTSFAYELSASTVYVRFYAWFPQHRAGDLLLLYTGANAGGTFLAGLGTKVNGNLDLVCGGAIVDVVGAIALNQWIRVEARFSTTTGAAVEVFNDADSGTSTASASTASNLASAAVTEQLLRATATTDFTYFDDFAVSDEGPIGPAVDSMPRPALIAATAVHRASRW